MGTVASRDLRNHTAQVLQRVREGEKVAVTVHGEVVAEIVPPTHARPAFFTRSQLIAVLEQATADPGLRTDLAALGEESTDDLGQP